MVFPASHEGKPVKVIGDAFSPNNKRIKRITIPEGYTSVGERAFNNCTGLTEVKFPEGLTSIGEWAFYWCSLLKDLNLPKGLTYTGDWAFSCCTWLAEISVDENNPVFCSVDGVLFDKAMTTLICFPGGKKGRYSVPEEIIAIKSDALSNCDLTGFFFPESLLIIEGFGFYSDQLKDITVS